MTVAWRPGGEGPLIRSWMEESGALTEGHFALSSGRHAGAYVQCALLLEEPVRARRLGEMLAAGLADAGARSVLSPALGGLIIGHEVGAALGVPFRFCERRDGGMVLRRGFRLARGERVVVVEDVVTTGGSTREAIAVAREAGAEVVAVGSIVDRSAAGADLFPLPYRSLLRLELPSWPAADCPLCREGGRPDRPGSRPGV